MLNNPVCFVIEHESTIQMLKLNELRIWAKGKFPKINTIDEEGKNKKRDFIDLWLEDPNHRTKDEMKFDPKMVDDNKYNMYKGSVYKKAESNIEEKNNIFFKLLKHISNDPIVYEYFKCWISHIVKTPYRTKKPTLLSFYIPILVVLVKMLLLMHYASGLKIIQVTLKILMISQKTLTLT